jgi:hypothetical protein
MIHIEAIPHRKHRYDTVGDWFFKKKHLVIRVSRMKNLDYIFLVALHEMVEAWLCFRRGISEKDVTRFDKAFEKKRPNGNFNEPGDDPKAPYRNEHRFATRVERMMAKELGVDWDEYDQTVSSL